jgi:hypothetical protein
VIESTETDQEEIVEVEEVEIEDDFEDVDVPFAVIEDVPIFPGCEKVAKSKRRECFQDQINKHIRKKLPLSGNCPGNGNSGEGICEFYNFKRRIDFQYQNAWSR